MPPSRPDHLSALAYLVERIAPESILDLGIGSGFKGAFFREYTDVWDHGVIPKGSGVFLEGVEIFGRMAEPLWDLYNAAHVGDVLEMVETFRNESMWKFDLVHCGDVIEHLPRSRGLALIGHMEAVARKAAVVVTPVVVRPQGTVFGNSHEHHVSQWTGEDFPSWTRSVFGNVAMYVWEPAKAGVK
ncbi:MAG: hypothetical protein MZV70_54500 [Desulfobacterales bacterium]|nr:hypothetical protein [Desulfobacterales bacterium]